MNGVSRLTHTEGVTLITFAKIPGDTGFVSEILSMATEAQVNIDMISLNDTQSGYNSLSFTVDDSQFGDILALVGRCKEKYPSVRPLVSSGNCLITLFGEEMRALPGVASTAISSVVRAGADLRMITTSAEEINLLVSESSVFDVMHVLKKAFSL